MSEPACTIDQAACEFGHSVGQRLSEVAESPVGPNVPISANVQSVFYFGRTEVWADNWPGKRRLENQPLSSVESRRTRSSVIGRPSVGQGWRKVGRLVVFARPAVDAGRVEIWSASGFLALFNGKTLQK